jgi:CubicO group peptidase (beta-lactamase class C family)
VRPPLVSGWLFAAAAFLLATAICTAGPLPSPILYNPSLASTRTYWPTSEWRIARPSETGMDASILDGLVPQLARSGALAALVVRRGLVVLEWYRARDGRDSLFNVYSCTKSILSAIVGIAIDRGLLTGVDRPVSEFFPVVGSTIDAKRKTGLTFRHLLAMTSGLDWPEWGSWNYYFQPMVDSRDWVQYVLGRPMAAEPGVLFNYNTGGSQVLSAVIGQVAGMSGAGTLETGMSGVVTSAAEFARRELFDPIGIGRVEWPADPTGVSLGGYGIRMSVRDAAKFAYLYLDNGAWDGHQVVSRAWVEESTRQQSDGHPWFGSYGLHWWLRSLADPRAASAFFAMGYGGQYLFVVPSLDLVAVFFSWMPGESSFLPMRWLEEFVIRSVR